MKILIKIFILGLPFYISCNEKLSVQSEIENAKSEIRKTDSSFCIRSIEKGFSYALIEFADSEVIKLNDGEFPVLGIEKLKSKLAGREKDESVISWKPLKITVSNSCDFGYSFGNWEYKTRTLERDTIYYGNYVTIWKKQMDGSWKYVLDGGNNTPKPDSITNHL